MTYPFEGTADPIVKYDFRPRFPLEKVQFWADRYGYMDDTEVVAMGDKARRRGWYTRRGFMVVTSWKTRNRTVPLCAENTEASVKRATRRSLSTDDEQIRIDALTSLHGVRIQTASALLHFAYPDSFPIIDFRALWSLGLESPPKQPGFALWWDYTQECRSLAARTGVSMRTLDRALWQYSNDIAEMRRLFERGQGVAEVAKALGVAYAFAYGVRKRWLSDKSTAPSH